MKVSSFYSQTRGYFGGNCAMYFMYVCMYVFYVFTVTCFFFCSVHKQCELLTIKKKDYTAMHVSPEKKLSNQFA